MSRSRVGLLGVPHDPVCRIQVDLAEGLVVEHNGQRYLFCSRACQKRFRVASKWLLQRRFARPLTGHGRPIDKKSKKAPAETGSR